MTGWRATPTAGSSDGPVPRRPPARPERSSLIGLAMLIIGLLPLGTLLCPGVAVRLAADRAGQAAIALPVIIFALAALTGARPGLRRLARRFRARPDKEHEFALLRVTAAAAMTAYAAVLGLALSPDAAAAMEWFVVASLGLSAGWGWLIAAMATARATKRRVLAAIFGDVVLLSAFLHVGAAAAACWWPLYLVLALYVGYRFGPGALAVAAAAGVVGFATVAVAAPFWQTQPFLTAGVLGALIGVPVCLAGVFRLTSSIRRDAAAVQDGRSRVLQMIAAALRRPEAETVATGEDPERFAGWATRDILAEIGEIVDLSAMETGLLTPSTESFDLHALLKRAVARARTEAARKGQAFSLRVDPTLPSHLRGAARQIAQIADILAQHAVAAAPAGAVRIRVDTAERTRGRLALRLAVDVPLHADNAATMQDGRMALRTGLAARFAELIGGSLEARDGRWTAVLPAVIDPGAVPVVLDLEQRPVLVVTEDSGFAGEIAEPLAAWRADVRWIGAGEAALAYIGRYDPAARAVMVVDARAQLLAELSFVHRVAESIDAPPFIVIVAAAEQVPGLAALDRGELDGIVPAPVDPAVLANALRVLPLEAGVAARRGLNDPMHEPAPGGLPGEVTSITEHPKFGTEVLDMRTVDALRGMDDGDAFLAEVADSFRAEASHLLGRADRAARTGDLDEFAAALDGLRSCAGAVGGARLREVAELLSPESAHELRARGSAFVDRLGAEATRLRAALLDLSSQRELRRR